MITLKKLHIFKKYSGDLYALRNSDSGEKEAVTSHDWFVIGNLLQDLRLVNRGLAAASYAIRVEEELKNACDDEITILALREMVE